MPILTQAQLIQKLGGDAAAAQLLPNRTTGGIDLDKLDAAIADAIGDIRAAYKSRYQSEEASPSQKTVRLAKQLGVYYAWEHAGAKIMPENVQRMYGSAKQDLRDIEQSESLPGENARSWFPYGVDNSAGGARWTAATLRRAGILGSR